MENTTGISEFLHWNFIASFSFVSLPAVCRRSRGGSGSCGRAPSEGAEAAAGRGTEGAPAGARPARPGSCSLHGHGRGSPGARQGRPAGAGPGRAEPGAARPGGLSQTKNSPGNQIRKLELEDFRIGAEGEMPGKQAVCRELLSPVTSGVLNARDRGLSVSFCDLQPASSCVCHIFSCF